MSDPAVYDAAVLGAGSGGGTAAAQIARRGGRVCLIEPGPLGGVCLNLGCMPTKAMLAASDVAWRMRTCRAFGIAPASPSVDGRAFMRRVADVVAQLRQRVQKATEANKAIDLLPGRGRLLDARTVAVRTPDGEKRVAARAIVIATGTQPVRPGFLPWGSGRVMTTDEAVVAADLPASVLIVGGGVIGCEFATLYSELGVRTCVVEMLPRLLPAMDEDAGSAVAALLARRGVEVITGHKIESVTDYKAGVAARLDDGRTLQAACALVAVGRRPNTDDIGLEAAGVRTADGIIPVDDRCRTNVAGVYAVGDVAEKRQYAHLADRMGVVAGDNVMGVETADDRQVVPVGVYTHPEVASVGLSLEAAKELSAGARVFRYSYAHSGTALVYDETEGQLKVVADADSGRIYGALWIGPRAIDMIQEIALAIRQGITMEQLYHTIHAHPTFQEAVAGLAKAWVSQAARRRG